MHFIWDIDKSHIVSLRKKNEEINVRGYTFATCLDKDSYHMVNCFLKSEKACNNCMIYDF
jgi:hypothetical protein